MHGPRIWPPGRRAGTLESMLTYSITDWLRAPGPRQGHVRLLPREEHGPAADFLEELCDRLDEERGDRRVCAGLRRIVRRLGSERVEELVARATSIYEGSGMLVRGGKRRRTLGGIFFRLAKDLQRVRSTSCWSPTATATHARVAMGTSPER